MSKTTEPSAVSVPGYHEVLVIDEPREMKPLDLRSIDLFGKVVFSKTALVRTNAYGNILLHFENRLTKSLVKPILEKLKEQGYEWDERNDRMLRCWGLVKGKEKKFLFIFSTRLHVSSIYELSLREYNDVSAAITKAATSRNPNRYKLFSGFRAGMCVSS